MDSLFLGINTYFVRTTLTQICLYKLIAPSRLTHLARTRSSPAEVCPSAEQYETHHHIWTLVSIRKQSAFFFPPSLPPCLPFFCFPQSTSTDFVGLYGATTSWWRPLQMRREKSFSVWMGVKEAFYNLLGFEFIFVHIIERFTSCGIPKSHSWG